MAETSFGRPAGYMAVGVVVNVEDDPTQSGLVKVRWHEGAASQNQMSEDDLPWTRCLFPVSNPSLNQTGGPHTGLRVGSTVYGTTVDGAGQEYMIVGSAPKQGGGEYDQKAQFDSDLPQPAKVQKNGKKGGGPESQPRFGDVNSVVAKESIVSFGETQGGKFGGAKFANIPDSIGLITKVIT